MIKWLGSILSKWKYPSSYRSFFLHMKFDFSAIFSNIFHLKEVKKEKKNLSKLLLFNSILQKVCLLLLLFGLEIVAIDILILVKWFQASGDYNAKLGVTILGTFIIFYALPPFLNKELKFTVHWSLLQCRWSCNCWRWSSGD